MSRMAFHNRKSKQEISDSRFWFSGTRRLNDVALFVDESLTVNCKRPGKSSRNMPWSDHTKEKMGLYLPDYQHGNSLIASWHGYCLNWLLCPLNLAVHRFPPPGRMLHS